MVSLFHTEVLKESAESFAMAKELYTVVASLFHLQYGNVLLASGSRAQLKTVIDNDWPFFTNYTESMKICLKHSKCDELHDVFETLGQFKNSLCQGKTNVSLLQTMLSIPKSIH